jgi:hypothetical protein
MTSFANHDKSICSEIEPQHWQPIVSFRAETCPSEILSPFLLPSSHPIAHSCIQWIRSKRDDFAIWIPARLSQSPRQRLRDLNEWSSGMDSIIVNKSLKVDYVQRAGGAGRIRFDTLIYMVRWSCSRHGFPLHRNTFFDLLAVNATEVVDRIIVAEMNVECLVSLGMEEAPALTETADCWRMKILTSGEFAII